MLSSVEEFSIIFFLGMYKFSFLFDILNKFLCEHFWDLRNNVNGGLIHSLETA